jgi:hypothetical protein
MGVSGDARSGRHTENDDTAQKRVAARRSQCGSVRACGTRVGGWAGRLRAESEGDEDEEGDEEGDEDEVRACAR